MKTQYLTTPFEIENIKRKGRIINGLVATENFFNPTNPDLDKISDFIKDCETIADIGSGYGLLITKLAKMNPEKKFTGIDIVYWQGNNFPIPKELPNLKFEFNGIEAMTSNKFDKRNNDRKFDGVICSWMPQEYNWNEMLAILSLKKVILILSENFVTGTIETYVGLGKLGFELIGRAWNSSDSLIQLWERK